jgi:hypothetical protein
MQVPDRVTVGRMLRQWRRERDPSLVPGLVPRRGRRRHVTQADMAELTSRDERWYRALEAGEPRDFSRHFLASVVHILELSEAQSATLYLAHGHQPDPHRGRTENVDPAMTWLVRNHYLPTYIIDAAWDVVVYNGLVAEWLPWTAKPGANAVAYVLSPEAKYQYVDWHRYWAPPLIAQLRASAQRHPDNQRLKEVINEVLQDDDVRTLWEHDTTAQVHPHGDVRPLYVPAYKPDTVVMVRVLAFAPLSDTALRMIILMPADESEALHLLRDDDELRHLRHRRTEVPADPSGRSSKLCQRPHWTSYGSIQESSPPTGA